MEKRQRYTVYTVLADGNQVDVLTTEDPREAMIVLTKERIKYGAHRHHAHGCYDPDDPARGDLRLNEIIGEMDIAAAERENVIKEDW